MYRTYNHNNIMPVIGGYNIINLLLITGADGTPLPSTLLATTLTIIVVKGGHDEDRRISKL